MTSSANGNYKVCFWNHKQNNIMYMHRTLAKKLQRKQRSVWQKVIYIKYDSSECKNKAGNQKCCLPWDFLRKVVLQSFHCLNYLSLNAAVESRYEKTPLWNAFTFTFCNKYNYYRSRLMCVWSVLCSWPIICYKCKIMTLLLIRTITK